MEEVPSIIEPNKPALAARISAQLFASVAAHSGSEQVKFREVEFLAFLEQLGVRDRRVAGQLWRLMAGEDAIGRLRRKLLIKPARKSVQSLLEKVRQVLRRNLAATQARVIALLNPILRGLGDVPPACRDRCDLYQGRSPRVEDAMEVGQTPTTILTQGATPRAN